MPCSAFLLVLDYEIGGPILSKYGLVMAICTYNNRIDDDELLHAHFIINCICQISIRIQRRGESFIAWFLMYT